MIRIALLGWFVGCSPECEEGVDRLTDDEERAAFACEIDDDCVAVEACACSACSGGILVAARRGHQGTARRLLGQCCPEGGADGCAAAFCQLPAPLCSEGRCAFAGGKPYASRMLLAE